MGHSSDKDIDKLIRIAKRAGWSFSTASNGHGKLSPPQIEGKWLYGKRVITFPLTPAGHSPAAKALRSKLRKRGVSI